MQLTVDTFDRTTAAADLRDDELLTHELRGRAIRRARELGVEQVEFWNSPYGRGADRMAGFVELARAAGVERRQRRRRPRGRPRRMDCSE